MREPWIVHEDAMSMSADLILDPLRLAALRDYGILDTKPEEGFDDIAHLAAEVCAAPMALVSLIDRDRQWFKARIGFHTCETDLDRSVCKFVLKTRRPDECGVSKDDGGAGLLKEDPALAKSTLSIICAIFRCWPISLKKAG